MERAETAKPSKVSIKKRRNKSLDIASAAVPEASPEVHQLHRRSCCSTGSDEHDELLYFPEAVAPETTLSGFPTKPTSGLTPVLDMVINNHVVEPASVSMSLFKICIGLYRFNVLHRFTE